MAVALLGINPDLTPPSEEFGPIEETEERLEDLRSLTHFQHELKKAGYVLLPLSQADLDKKRRCQRCTKVVRKGHERQKSKSLHHLPLAPVISQPKLLSADEFGNRTQPQAPLNSSQQESSAVSSDEITDGLQGMMLKKKEPPMNCKFHAGSIRQRTWTCCNKHPGSPPCRAEQFHTTKTYKPGELESNWRYFPTPPAPAAETQPSSSHVTAVVLDCEMGSAESGESELIRISAVDFFTRQVLLDSLVYPDVRMAHYNTRYSGVTRYAMEDALRRKKCLRGRAAARKALWKFVGPETTVIGHAGHGDLSSLRCIHQVIVDTLLLETRLQPRDEEQEAQRKQDKEKQTEVEETEDGGVPLTAALEPAPKPAEGETPEKPKYPGLSLKALAQARLKREIQVKGKGHDSLEDALATRDLLLWHLINKPVPPQVYAAPVQEEDEE